MAFFLIFEWVLVFCDPGLDFRDWLLQEFILTNLEDLRIFCGPIMSQVCEETEAYLTFKLDIQKHKLGTPYSGPFQNPLPYQPHNVGNVGPN